MNVLHTFLPPDRLRALERNTALPDRAEGAVLFADVSGFTALAEAMTQSWGARRGAEELTRQLNTVYDALIAEIETYDGSVIGFAGDAALCWFADTKAKESPGALRAVTCALALHRAMEQLAHVPLPDGSTVTLAAKVAVATGSVRRFVVGDASVHYIDVIAGSTVTRTATAEGIAHSGEILVDTATARALDSRLDLQAWRTAADTGEQFGVVRTLHANAPRQIPPPLPVLADTEIKTWLHDDVYRRLQTKGEIFLTELRPVVALFARFQGIDFEHDAKAGEKLNQFIIRAQQILARYDGALLEITIGDKGSYFYATFGAPRIHEDDARRAVFAGRELLPLSRELGFLEPLQVGISQGIMRAGAYGSNTRRMYGVQGDEVNIAARLMIEAAPGTLLVSGRIQKAIANEFDLEPLPPIRLKGKTEPLLPFVVQGLRETRLQQLQEAYYSLPMIGREAELYFILEKLEQARRGSGQIIGIVARAGMGKSRLTAEVIRTVRRRRESSFGGECQSFGQRISFLAWVPVWRAFFGMDANMSVHRQIRTLASRIDELLPDRAKALPLLSSLVDLPIPENDFTQALEPEFRKSALYALLRDCLAAAAQEARAQKQILLFVLEDVHWIDSASRELLQELAGGIATLPVVFLLNYRPPESSTEHLPYIENPDFFTEISLADLTDEQGEGLIRAKLAQHAPESGRAIPAALIERVNAQAQGNPFYIEQLLDYMHDRGVNLNNAADVTNFELPNTLHRLILSRIGQLNEHQQLTLKAASIIGRVFSLAHLCGYFPDVGLPDQVRDDLLLLTKYDLTAIDASQHEPAYLFKHIVTHQVAYESLPFATRAALHEAYAHFIETQAAPERALDLIAYHYDRSNNLRKRLEYLQRAGEAAAARFANVEAIDYLTRALELTLPDEYEKRYAILFAREHVFEVQGERERQRADLDTLEEITRSIDDDPIKHSNVLLEQGWLAERLGDHKTTRRILLKLDTSLSHADLTTAQLGNVQIELNLLQGVMHWQQGQLEQARTFMEQAAELSLFAGESKLQARVQSFLGTVYRELGDLRQAQACFDRQIALARERGDRRSEWAALNNLGLIATAHGDFEQAPENYSEALRIAHEIGDRHGEGLLLNNLAISGLDRGEYDQALAFSQRALVIMNTIGDRREISRMVLTLGELYRLVGRYKAGQTHINQAKNIARDLNERMLQAYAFMNLAAIDCEQNEFAHARMLCLEILPLAREIQHREGEAFLLNTLGRAQLGLGDLDDARASFEQALVLWQTQEPSPYVLQAHAGLAETALKQENLARARTGRDAIFEFLQQHPNRAGDPSALAARFTCYQVQRAGNEPAAMETLAHAYQELQARANKISDADMKRSFLENVPANAQIVHEWNAQHPI